MTVTVKTTKSASKESVLKLDKERGIANLKAKSHISANTQSNSKKVWHNVSWIFVKINIWNIVKISDNHVRIVKIEPQLFKLAGTEYVDHCAYGCLFTKTICQSVRYTSEILKYFYTL